MRIYQPHGDHDDGEHYCLLLLLLLTAYCSLLTCHVLDILTISYIHKLIKSSQQSCKIGVITISILQMTKLELQENPKCALGLLPMLETGFRSSLIAIALVCLPTGRPGLGGVHLNLKVGDGQR